MQSFNHKLVESRSVLILMLLAGILILVDGTTLSKASTRASSDLAIGGHNWVIPGVAHLPGGEDTTWRTSLAAVNHSGELVQLTLTFKPSEPAMSQTSVTLALAGGATVEWQDVLVELFGYSSTDVVKGAVHVEADDPLAITARTYNLANSGTFGQYLPALTSDQSMTAGHIGIIPQLKSNSAFRSNIGILNFGGIPCAVEFALCGSDGNQLGNQVTVDLEPGQYWQGNDIFGERLTGAGDQAIAYALIRTTTAGGLFWAFGSVIDNATGDPTTIPVLEGPMTISGEPVVVSIRPVTTIGQGGYHPRWSPDGQTIAFTDQRSGEPQAYILPSAGGQERHIATGLEGDHALAWLPDGRHLAFDAYVPESGRLAIWRIELDNGEVSRVTSGWNPSCHPHWRDDGSRVAYTFHNNGNSDIWSQAAGGGDLRRHTSDPADDWHPQWSPDGTRLLFTSDRSGNSDIWLVDVNTGQLTQVTAHTAADDRAVWSPDGRWIAFNSERSGLANIWVVAAEGGDPVRLTTDGDGGGRMPDWSPDGEQIAYVAAGQIWAMSISR